MAIICSADGELQLLVTRVQLALDRGAHRPTQLICSSH
jgi:hypothetical protein